MATNALARPVRSFGVSQFDLTFSAVAAPLNKRSPASSAVASAAAVSAPGGSQILPDGSMLTPAIVKPSIKKENAAAGNFVLVCSAFITSSLAP